MPLLLRTLQASLRAGHQCFDHYPCENVVVLWLPMIRRFHLRQQHPWRASSIALFVECAAAPNLTSVASPVFGALRFSAPLEFVVGSVVPKVVDAAVFYIPAQTILYWKKRQDKDAGEAADLCREVPPP